MVKSSTRATYAAVRMMAGADKALSGVGWVAGVSLSYTARLRCRRELFLGGKAGAANTPRHSGVL